MNLKRSTVAMLLGTAVLSGCSLNGGAPFEMLPRVDAVSRDGAEQSNARPSGLRAAVNAGREQLAAIASAKTPSLRELQELEPTGPEFTEDEEGGDKLRRPAMRDTALAYGARGGLAHTSRQINQMLQTREAKLDRIYDFNSVVIRGPDNTLVLPPVISEAKDAYELHDAGKSVRVADQVYEIIEQARFAPIAPLWHAYLIRDYSAPKPPPDEILPKTPEERAYWAQHIEKGWEAGVDQANEIFKADLNRLDRDFQGMVRYKVLLSEGKVSAPLLSKAPMGVTGTGQDMRVNDRSIRIMQDPELELDPTLWIPTIGNGPPAEYARPRGSTQVHDYPMDADRQY